MDYTRLGRSGLTVSRVCLGGGGSSRYGLRPGENDAEVIRLLHAGLDLGINFFDTAPNYGTEQILGKALDGHRHEIVISTKVRCTRPGTPMGGTDFSDPADIRDSIEASLRNLRTDRLDIVHLHGVRPHQYDTVVETIVPELTRLVEAGKIGSLGLSESFGSDPEHEVALRAVADGRFSVLMLGYNMVNPSAGRLVLPAAKRADIGVMCMFAVRGALARRELVATLVADLVASGEVDAADLDPADPLGFLLDDGISQTLTEAAYRYCRHTDGIDVVMTGTGNRQHLQENVASILADPLPAEALQRLSRVFARVTSATGTMHNQG